MKILFYSSTQPGALNRLNINTLVTSKPDYEYCFVLVRRRPISILTRLKRLLVAMRDGKNHWEIDNRKLERKIARSTPKLDLSRHKTHFVEAVNDEPSQRIIADFKPDFIIQSGAGILKECIFSLSRIATLNVHHGYAPEIRGMRSTFWCLFYGLTDHLGVTCHVIDKNIDTGPVVCRHKYEHTKSTPYSEIQEELAIEGARLLVKATDILQSTSRIENLGTVNSYYFSAVDPRLYRELKAGGFKPVRPATELKTKSKPHNQFITGNSAAPKKQKLSS